MIHFMYGPAFGWPWWVAFGTNILFWALIIGAIVALVSLLARRPTPMTPQMPMPTVSSLEILSQRYARGEIDAATYEDMRRRILGASGPATPPPGVSV
jgi:putative membrane protein